MQFGYTIVYVAEPGATTLAAAVQRAVDAGATRLQAPAAKPWGQTVAYVRAPDGTPVEPCTPMH